MSSLSDKHSRLKERLTATNPIITAEGYLMELERRGYNKNGSFVPTVVLEHPEKVEELAHEFVHAGSDVTQAFVYYANKEKMKDIGREEEYWLLNERAHEIAQKVARETGTLFCSGLGTTNVYDPAVPDTWSKCEAMFREQISVSVKYDVDFVAIETIWDYGEASIALKVCNELGVPAVVTLAPAGVGAKPLTFDGYSLVDALQKLEAEGAVCVGLNCGRGPATMLPLIRELRQHIKGPLACVSVGYRTTVSEPTWWTLRHPELGIRSFPDHLAAHYLAMADVTSYAKQLKEIGVEYVGFCCGNVPVNTRALAMEYGRNPPSAKYCSDFHEKNSITRGKDSYTTSRYTEDFGKFLGLQD